MYPSDPRLQSKCCCQAVLQNKISFHLLHFYWIINNYFLFYLTNLSAFLEITLLEKLQLRSHFLKINWSLKLTYILTRNLQDLQCIPQKPTKNTFSSNIIFGQTINYLNNTYDCTAWMILSLAIFYFYFTRSLLKAYGIDRFWGVCLCDK